MSTHAPLPVLTRRPHVPAPERDDAWPEVMLYFGNDCNRQCGFCCVEGRPNGTFTPFRAADVRMLARRIRPDARIKVYGGEPTLHHRHLMRVMRTLRAAGYTGRCTIFSNGIQARRLIAMLEADPPRDGHAGSDAYLNHAIWHGAGEAPIPAGRRRELLEWASAHPGRLWLGHADVLPVGAATAAPAADPGFGGHCARCFPTLRSDGRVHACAFAAELDAPVYGLGDIADDAAVVLERRARFLRWIDEEIEPEAQRRGVPACTVCLERARAVPLRRT